MKIIIVLVLAFVVSCASDPAPVVAHSSDTLYTCYTHATCNGVQVDQRHELCARPSSLDVVISGDAASTDWELAWRAACSVNQGNVLEQGHTCGDTWGCEATCVPTFDACNE